MKIETGITEGTYAARRARRKASEEKLRAAFWIHWNEKLRLKYPSFEKFYAEVIQQLGED